MKTINKQTITKTLGCQQTQKATINSDELNVKLRSHITTIITYKKKTDNKANFNWIETLKTHKIFEKAKRSIGTVDCSCVEFKMNNKHRRSKTIEIARSQTQLGPRFRK